MLHTWAYSPDEMSEGFFTYWSKYWQRDDPDDDDSRWTQALQFVDKIPKCDTIDLNIDHESLEEAIRSTPSNSSRGLCGWGIREIKMLPRNHIRRLATLLNHFIQNEWPKVLTWVRLALPPKCPDPSRPEHGRPICVMSLIYRLGAKVIAKKILCHLSSQLPSQICGGVPGRDATFIWYGIQAQIERAHYQNETLVGFCMDIQKCYNAIPRRVVIHALIRAGVPEVTAWSWYKLLQNLHRSVVIQNSASEMSSSTTGIPEGDPIAVPAMAIVCWIFWTITKLDECVPWTYADNWELVASSSNQLSEAVKKALEFMRSWKLDIDADKSWAWSTKPLPQHQIEMLSSLLVQTDHHDQVDGVPQDPFKPLRIVRANKDLGATMRYRKSLCITNIKQRFDKSISRIRRLLSVPCSLELVWRAINVGAISCALYGIETLPLGFQHFHRLRSAMADTVCETYKNRSELLATACTSACVGDPEVKTIKKCVRTCRKFLVLHPELIQISFQILANSPADAKKIFGPLGCLKRWFTRLNWDVREDGCLITSQKVALSLLFTCPDEIAHHIDLSWAEFMSNQVSHRKGMHDLPHLNLRATARHLKKFDEVDQRILCKYMSGAFAHGDKNIHRGTSDGSCPFCSAPDSLEHRIQICPAFQDIRNNHLQTLQWINENSKHWNATPIISCHPDETLWHQFKTIVSSPISRNLDLTSQQVRRFFTDGSCRTPLIPEAAFASWSVVEDVSVSDEQRLHFAEIFQKSGNMPQCFPLCCRSQVRGRQTNDRAELCAVICALSQSFLVEIYTDSLYTINTLTRVLDGLKPEQFINDTNSDLIQELCYVVAGRSWTHIAIHHVRSHQVLTETADKHLLFLQLGNHEADRHAGLVWEQDVGSTMQSLVQNIIEHYNTVAHFHLDFLTFLCQLCKRVSDLNPGKSTQNSVQTERCSDVLLQWTVPGEIQIFDVKLQSWMTTTLPHPSHFVKHVAAYFDALEWPVHPQSQDPGITWLELLVDFVSATKSRIPNQRGRYSNQYIFLDSLNSDVLDCDGLNQRISTFRSCAKFLGRVLRRPIFPTQYQQTKCESLLYFVNGRISSGFAVRPKLLLPHRTVTSIRRFHESGAHVGKSSKFHDSFPFDTTEAFIRIPDNIDPDPSFERRINRFGELLRVRQRDLATWHQLLICNSFWARTSGPTCASGRSSRPFVGWAVLLRRCGD